MQSIEQGPTIKTHIIQKASQEDLEELKALLLLANAYSLQLSDIPTWKNTQVALQAFEQQVIQDNTYVIRNYSGTITSSISLSETDTRWNDENGEQEALYFTKLMKHPEKSQPDEAEQLLLFAAEEAKKRNKTLLRCDVIREQSGIISYYENLGFQKKGNFLYSSNKYPGTLMEIPVAQFLEHIITP